jgi:hypothetical protein
MKKWLAIALFLLIVGCTVIQPPEPGAKSSSASPQAEVGAPVSPPPTLSPPTDVPRVDRQRLMTHLQALVGERYSSSARDRVRMYLVNTLKQYGWTVTTQPFQSGVNVLARQTTDPPSTDSDTLDTLDIDFLTQTTQLVVNATTVLLDSSRHS